MSRFNRSKKNNAEQKRNVYEECKAEISTCLCFNDTKQNKKKQKKKKKEDIENDFTEKERGRKKTKTIELRKRGS